MKTWKTGVHDGAVQTTRWPAASTAASRRPSPEKATSLMRRRCSAAGAGPLGAGRLHSAPAPVRHSVTLPSSLPLIGRSRKKRSKSWKKITKTS